MTSTVSTTTDTDIQQQPQVHTSNDSRNSKQGHKLVMNEQIVYKGLVRHFGITLVTLVVSFIDLMVQTIAQDYDMLWLFMIDIMIHATANVAIFSDARQVLLQCCRIMNIQGLLPRKNKPQTKGNVDEKEEGNNNNNNNNSRIRRREGTGDKDDIDFGSQIRYETVGIGGGVDNSISVTPAERSFHS